jgi:hypothetical protein
MIDGQIVNTPLHILSFDLYDLPKEITLSFLKVKVEPYIPTPMQCKNCYRIGHTKKICKVEKKCFVCSLSEHEDPCKKVECINCKEEHRSNNKKCPTFQKRQKILKYKTLNKVSYQQAVININNEHSQKQENTAPVVESLETALDIKKKHNANTKSNISNKNINSEKNKQNNITPNIIPTSNNLIKSDNPISIEMTDTCQKYTSKNTHAKLYKTANPNEKILDESDDSDSFTEKNNSSNVKINNYPNKNKNDKLKHSSNKNKTTLINNCENNIKSTLTTTSSIPKLSVPQTNFSLGNEEQNISTTEEAQFTELC